MIAHIFGVLEFYCLRSLCAGYARSFRKCLDSLWLIWSLETHLSMYGYLVGAILNTILKTNPIQATPIEYKVEFTKILQTTPKTTPPTPRDNTTPLPDTFYHTNTPKYKPQQCILYIDGSFIPPNEHVIGALLDQGVYNPNNDLYIIEKLPGLPNILRGELCPIHCPHHHKRPTAWHLHIYQHPQ